VCPRHVRNRVCACASGAFAPPRLLRRRSDVHMGPAMSDHEEPIRLADAAVRRLHDLFDVMRAIAAARGAQEDPVRITVAIQLAHAGRDRQAVSV
jgi:hypothetical protein